MSMPMMSAPSCASRIACGAALATSRARDEGHLTVELPHGSSPPSLTACRPLVRTRPLPYCPFLPLLSECTATATGRGTMSVQTTVDELRARPGTGETIAIIDPVTEEQFAEFTDGGAAAVDEAVGRARETLRVRGVAAPAAGGAGEGAVADRRPARGAGRRARRARLAQHRHAARPGRAQHQRRGRVLPVLLRVVHQGQRHRLRPPPVGRPHGRRPLGARLHAQGARRRRRAHRPVERPGVQRRRQAGAGARRRVQQHPQAGRGDAALGAGVRAGARRGRRARRRGEHRERATATPPARPSSTTPASTRSPSPAPPRWARRSSRARPATSSG